MAAQITGTGFLLQAVLLSQVYAALANMKWYHLKSRLPYDHDDTTSMAIQYHYLMDFPTYGHI